MTVAELVSKLKTVHPDTPVYVGERSEDALVVWPVNASVLSLDNDTTIVVLVGCCSTVANALADGSIKGVITGPHEGDVKH